ncbi:MAG: response regulator transcription factor [Eubacterium sp.]|nr:response regulator transcription factor [Eubacterium sp.]MBR1675291.1 response regulator transcription factor [Eubacterium sp.]
MSKILIIEDEEKIARFVELELKHEGNQTDKAFDGRSGLEKALEGDYDLILLDIMLPELSGIEVLRRFRQKKDTPVIMLTARDAVMDKVAGLDAGADDYITKPFAIEELLARIRVALKKRSAVVSQDSVQEAPVQDKSITIGDVTLNEERHEVKYKDERLDFTNREFELLRVLMVNKNIVMSRDKLMNLVCGYDYMGETNVIDVYVRYIRTKLDDRFGIHFITTVRGVGYVIRDGE